MLRAIGGYVTKRYKPNLGHALAGAATAYDVYSYRQTHPDRGWAEAALYGAGMYALWTYAAPVALAWTFKDVTKAVGSAVTRLVFSEVAPPGYREGIGRGFLDSAAKATMRQRAVQALQESRSRANFILGTEARRISRGYFEL